MYSYASIQQKTSLMGKGFYAIRFLERSQQSPVMQLLALIPNYFPPCEHGVLLCPETWQSSHLLLRILKAGLETKVLRNTLGYLLAVSVGIAPIDQYLSIFDVLCHGLLRQDIACLRIMRDGYTQAAWERKGFFSMSRYRKDQA